MRSKNKVEKQPDVSLKGVKKNILTGRVQFHRDGYAFLIPDQKDVEDLFIPAHALSNTFDGDLVEVEVFHGPSQRREARILRLLERTKLEHSGQIEKNKDEIWVNCESQGQKMRVWVPQGKDLGAKKGQWVVVRLIGQFWDKSRKTLLEGEVIRLLGKRGVLKTELELTLAEFQTRRDFDESVLLEADACPSEISEEELESRRDLRDLPFVTIDGESAKDFDDAILVQPIAEGYRLLVAIADVSYYVRPGSGLDQEALDRATSVYFPASCIPMLPERLSNGLCSLVPNVDRLAFVVEMDFDLKGSKLRTDFYKAVIKNHARLTYTIVHQMIVEKKPELRRKYKSFLKDLEVSFGLFQVLRDLRFRRGSLDFDLPEPEILLDIEEGIVHSIARTSRNQAHLLIEEFMIAANESVAEYLVDQNVPSLYRIHEDPDREKLENFKRMMQGLGISVAKSAKLRPKDLAKALQQVRGRPEERLMNTLLLRSLKQAVYSPENVGHFGLASPKYTHFTSPIRRYPDLVVHRVLQQTLLRSTKKRRSKKQGLSQEELTTIAEQCSARERVAMKTEWAIRDLYVTVFMKDKVGEEFEGVISSVARFGFFVELDAYFVEGLVHVRTLEEDYYEYHESRFELLGRRLKKRFKIGDRVKICVAQVDVLARKIDFQFLGRAPAVA